MAAPSQCPACGAEIPKGSSEGAVCPVCLRERTPTADHRLAGLQDGEVVSVRRKTRPIAPPPVLTRRTTRFAPLDRLIRPAFLLLTRRLSDPGEETPGFREKYFCPKCRDPFVLGWKPTYSPLVQHCNVVPDSHPLLRGRDPRMVPVFCPKCGTDCRAFGKIPHPEVPVVRPDEIRVLQSFDFPLLSSVPSKPAGRIKPTGPRIEKMVLFVTGEIPAGLDVKEFAYSMVTVGVYPRFGRGFRVSENGDSRLHVLRVSKVVNRSDWLIPVVQREFFQTEACGMKMFAIANLITLEPPLGEAAFCMVFPYRPARHRTPSRKGSPGSR